MIAPMKTVWLAVREKDKLASLVELRALGLVHLETAFPSGQQHESLVKSREELAAARNMVPPFKSGTAQKLSTEEAVARARSVLAASVRIEELRRESARLSRELDHYAPWGELDPAALKAMEASGLKFRFFTVTTRSLAILPGSLEYIVLARSPKSLRIAVVLDKSGAEPVLPADSVELKLPQESTQSMRSLLAAIGKEIASRQAEITAASSSAPAMAEAIKAIEQEISFQTVSQSLTSEGAVAWIKGYVPAASVSALKAQAAASGWGLALDDPSSDETPPTKVENNAFVRIIAPIFDFLGTVPGYREYEISSYFLVFFCIFFAMIFGDAGYGSLMFAVAVYLALKSTRGGKAVPDAIRLFLLLSFTTIVWGTMTASWFSIPADSLPGFLKAISIPWFSGVVDAESANALLHPMVEVTKLFSADTVSIPREVYVTQNVQVFCFVLGLLHLSIARIKNILRDLPDLKFLGQAGALAQVVGMFFFVLNLVVDTDRFPAPGFALWCVLGGFIVSLLFGGWNGNLLKSALEGLKNIIPNFLGAVGVFADIVSYIRLWAVGLAGAKLGSIINMMGAGMLKPVIMIAFGIMLFVFGHGLNMVLSVLSVVVHGVRLNMLEFSNHLGMEWSGTKYEPFRVTYDSER